MSSELLNILSDGEGLLEEEEEHILFKEIFKKEEYVKQIEEAKEGGRNSIEVDYEDIKTINPEIAEVLLIKNGWKELSNYALDVIHPKNEIKHIKYSNIPFIDLKDLKRSGNQGKLVRTEGIVKMAGQIKPDPRMFTYACTCSEGTVVKVDMQKGGKPNPDDLCSCGKLFKHYDLVNEDYEQTQWLKIQEKPEGTGASTQPKDIKVLLEGDLVDSTVVGDVIELTGVLSASVNLKNRNKNFFYLKGNNVKVEDKGYEDINYTEEEVEQFIELSKNPELQERIEKTIAPRIVGLEEEKKAIALQLFGGVPEYEGTWVRGDIHVLVMGDPAIGKSSVFKYVSKNLAPKCVYASGKGASGVGLTAAVLKAGEFGDDGEWIFEAGAMVLADNGLCVIDELDKMTPEDRKHIGDGLEDQEIYLNKAGVNATLRSRCSVLAGGNPEGDRVDRRKEDIISQLKLDPHLISRFDFIYVREDQPGVNRDTAVGEAILKKKVRDNRKEEGIPPELLKKYIAYARDHVNPVINDEANNILLDWYVKVRNPEGNDEEEISSLSARFLQALKRTTQARARMHLREEATVEDAYKTIEIMKESLESSGRDPISGRIDVRLAEGRKPKRQDKIDKIVEEVIVEFNEEYYNPAKPYEWFNNPNIRDAGIIKVLEKGKKLGLSGLTLSNAEEELKKGITLRLTNGIP